MRRREFIALLGGASAWSLAARAQQVQTRRIGVLMNRAPDDPEGQAGIAAFQQALQQLGWKDGDNARVDICWGADDADRERKCTAELTALMPDIILASGTLSVLAVQQLNRSQPIGSCSSTTQSAVALSTTSPGRAATSPAL
jgi:putative tryptophan/tyrosine transport system substrate-binding protein